MSRTNTREAMGQEIGVVAPNYHPLPVVVTEASGAWVTDVDGNRYLDALAGYSAVNFGHANPRLLHAAKQQMDRLTMTSRAFYNDRLGPFCKALAGLTGQQMILPMNTGAEAVETAIKAARKWGYEAKGVASERAEIIVMDQNFHGRTTTVISFSSDDESKENFGPYTPGFVTVPFNDLDAVSEAITPNTVGVLVELIQGEAGVRIADPDYARGLRELCTENDALMIVDEVQSGFGRTGETFASSLYGISPDIMILGKALGGGIIPVSAIAGRADVLSHLTPGTHGSTFGGNPLAAAIGSEVVKMMEEGKYQANAVARGNQLAELLEALQADYPDVIRSVSQVGLWVGIDFNPEYTTGREVCHAMLSRGVLMKDAHGSVVRISPPLMVSEGDIDFLAGALRDTVKSMSQNV